MLCSLYNSENYAKKELKIATVPPTPLYKEYSLQDTVVKKGKLILIFNYESPHLHGPPSVQPHAHDTVCTAGQPSKIVRLTHTHAYAPP